MSMDAAELKKLLGEQLDPICSHMQNLDKKMDTVTEILSKKVATVPGDSLLAAQQFIRYNADLKKDWPGATYIDTHCHLDLLFSKQNHISFIMISTSLIQ